MPRLTTKEVVDLIAALNDFSNTMSLDLDLAIEPVMSDARRWRLAHRYGTEVVTEDWLIAIGSGSIDPTPVLRTWWAKGEEQRRADANRPLIRLDPNTPADQVYVMSPGQLSAYRDLMNMGSWTSDNSRDVFSGGDPNRVAGWESDRERAIAREQQRLEQYRIDAARREAIARARRTEEMQRAEDALRQQILDDAAEREIPDIVPRKRRVQPA